MSSAQISCVMPVRDGERFLGEAIESALGQTRPPLEILVVIDGGTDRSAEVAMEFGPSVRLLRTPGLGPASARNMAIAEARGDLIALLDCDDIWHPQKLEAQVAVIAAADSAAVCLCGVENFWMEEVEQERLHVAETRFSSALPGYCSSAFMASKELFERLGGFDPNRRHTDLVNWVMRAEAAGVEVTILPEVLVRRRRHSSNMSRVASQTARDEFLELVRDKLRSARSSAGGR